MCFITHGCPMLIPLQLTAAVLLILRIFGCWRRVGRYAVLLSGARVQPPSPEWVNYGLHLPCRDYISRAYGGVDIALWAYSFN